MSAVLMARHVSELEWRERHAAERRARRLCEADPDFAPWANGYGVIRHVPFTQLRTYELVDELVARGSVREVAEGHQPGRFRTPCDAPEATYTHDDATVAGYFPIARTRVFLGDARLAPFLGVLRLLDERPATAFTATAEASPATT